MNLKNTSSYLFAFALLVSAIAIQENVKANIIVSETLDYVWHVDKYKALKIAKQISILKHKYNQKEQHYHSKLKTPPAKINITKAKHNDDIDQKHSILPEFEALEINNQLTKLQNNLDKALGRIEISKTQNIFNKNIVQSDLITNHFKNVATSTDLYSLKRVSRKEKLSKTITTKERKLMNLVSISRIGYWQTVHSIESKQGKLLFRPRNKSRSCNQTLGPCGHHQLNVQALKDIGCNSLQCRKDRINYKKSLELSKKLLALNEKRLRKNGITKLRGYQKYLIHQQGAYGIKNIIAATQGKKVLSKTIKKNMANNSPYSYKQLKDMDSKVAANKFMQHWKSKWLSEKRLIVASQAKTTLAKTTDNLTNPNFIPTFDDSELNLALNIKF